MNFKRFIDPWFSVAGHHRIMARYLFDPKIKKLMFNLPPQHGKTETVTISAPPFILGHNPDTRIISVAYNQEQIQKYSFESMRMVENPRFYQLFGLLPDPSQFTKSYWKIKGHRGGVVASGVGSSITGNPADWLFVDDPTKNIEEAFSKTFQDAIWDWWCYVAKTRMAGEAAKTVISVTRWGEDDLPGRILKWERENNIPAEDRFTVVSLPAIDLTGVEDKKDYTRGRALWPEKKSLKFLIEMWRLNPTMFEALYQQNPCPEEDLALRSEWWTIVDSMGEEKLVKAIRGYDFGFRTRAQNDFTATAKVGRYQSRWCLEECIQWKKNIPETIQEIKRIARQDGPGVPIVCETNGGQDAIVQMLKSDPDMGDYTIVGRDTKGDKFANAVPWILRVKDGFLVMRRDAWNRDFLNQCDSFRRSSDHEDMIDAVSRCWALIGRMASDIY